MKTCLFLLFLVPIICYGQNPDIDSIPIKHQFHKHPFPRLIAGIKVGNTIDSIARSILGAGFYDPEPSHGGSRTYFDSSKNIQFRYEIGPDGVIDDITVTRSEFPLEELKSKQNLESSKIYIKSLRYSVIGNITFGDNYYRITNQFGKPNKDYFENGNRIIKFIDDTDSWDEVLYYEATFTLKDDKIIRIELYSGE